LQGVPLSRPRAYSFLCLHHAVAVAGVAVALAAVAGVAVAGVLVNVAAVAVAVFHSDILSCWCVRRDSMGNVAVFTNPDRGVYIFDGPHTHTSIHTHTHTACWNEERNGILGGQLHARRR